MTSASPLAAPLLVFGEALVDVFDGQEVPGGASFNVACHLAGLGARPWLITRVGDDPAATRLRERAERLGLDWSTVQVDARHPTGRVLVHHQGNSHRFEILADQAYDHIDAAPVLDAWPPVVAGEPLPWLYHGTLALRDAGSREALERLRASVPHRRFVDLNWREEGPAPEQALELMRGADVLKLNDEELQRVRGWLGQPSTTPPVAPQLHEKNAGIASLLDALDVSRLLVTHGAEGAALWSRDGRCEVLAPAPALTQITDTVGAGDSFTALMLAALAADEALADALPRAAAFAAAVCGLRGGVPDDPSFYAPWRRP